MHTYNNNNTEPYDHAEIIIDIDGNNSYRKYNRQRARNNCMFLYKIVRRAAMCPNITAYVLLFVCGIIGIVLAAITLLRLIS